jgi:hypothetical protein
MKDASRKPPSKGIRIRYPGGSQIVTVAELRELIALFRAARLNSAPPADPKQPDRVLPDQEPGERLP